MSVRRIMQAAEGASAFEAVDRRSRRMTMIDDTDRRLLRILQADGRITNQELASRANLSPAACHERVKRLRERGVITGYTATLDPEKVGRGLMVFVEVVLDRT